MTRIVAGVARGRRLGVPPRGTRPTSDRAREGLFSSLDAEFGGLGGLRVLDLYAGSGAVGLEAWSRGAGGVVLVESATAALKVLRANVAALLGPDAGPQPQRRLDVVDGLVERVVTELAGPPFDIVFADPPYATPDADLGGVLQTLRARGLLHPDAVVVVERSSRDGWRWPAGFEPTRERSYGEATLYYARRAREDAGPAPL